MEAALRKASQYNVQNKTDEYHGVSIRGTEEAKSSN